MPPRRRSPRHALVLAGGGVVGGLYEVGALLALDEVFEGHSVCDFDLYVGSSAGAFVSALLANHVSPARIRDALMNDRSTLPHLSASQFLSIPWRDHVAAIPRIASALPRVAIDLWQHWGEALPLDTIANLARLLPQGFFSLDGIEHYVRHVLSRSGRSNDFRRLRRRLLIPSTILDSGETTPISMAVAASAAIPLVYEPVRIAGVDYIDAAVTKTAHAGLAVDQGAGLVLVVNPLRPVVLDPTGETRIRDGGPFAVAGQALRVALQRRLHEGLRRHAFQHQETDILLFEPYERDLHLFDYHLMTYALWHEVIRRGYRTTIKVLLGDYERYAAVFARHGIGLVGRSLVERRARRWGQSARRAA
jgi:NTE family protein